MTCLSLQQLLLILELLRQPLGRLVFILCLHYLVRDDYYYESPFSIYGDISCSYLVNLSLKPGANEAMARKMFSQWDPMFQGFLRHRNFWWPSKDPRLEHLGFANRFFLCWERNHHQVSKHKCVSWVLTSGLKTLWIQKCLSTAEATKAQFSYNFYLKTEEYRQLVPDAINMAKNKVIINTTVAFNTRLYWACKEWI